MDIFALETPNEWGQGTSFHSSYTDALVEGLHLCSLLESPNTFYVWGFEIDRLSWEVFRSSDTWIPNATWDLAGERIWAAYEASTSSEDAAKRHTDRFNTMMKNFVKHGGEIGVQQYDAR